MCAALGSLLSVSVSSCTVHETTTPCGFAKSVALWEGGIPHCCDLIPTMNPPPPVLQHLSPKHTSKTTRVRRELWGGELCGLCNLCQQWGRCLSWGPVFPSTPDAPSVAVTVQVRSWSHPCGQRAFTCSHTHTHTFSHYNEMPNHKPYTNFNRHPGWCGTASTLSPMMAAHKSCV